MLTLLRPLFLILIIVSCGCGGSAVRMESLPLVQAEGQILIDGQPQPRVHIFLFPDDPTQAAKPHGITDNEGKFHLETYRQSGAPVGVYSVSVYWPANPKPEQENDDGAAPPDRLGRKYADPKTSQLKAQITSHATTIPKFELTNPKTNGR